MPQPRSVRRLNQLSFRRDVRLFFGALVGFLTCLIVLLLILLQTYVAQLRSAATVRWEQAAAIATDAINETASQDPASVAARLTLLQTRHEIAGIVVQLGAQRIESGVPPEQEGVEIIERDLYGGKLVLAFDATRLRQAETTFRATAAICLIATALVAVLLALYLPKITRPIEDMLAAAGELVQREPHDDEQQYLVDTFRTSVSTLRRQEEELRAMHAWQKMRADDLERVTAALTRSLTSGFMAVDPAGLVVEVNAAGREIVPPVTSPHGIDVVAAFGENGFTEAIRKAVDERLAMSRIEVQLDERVIGLTTAPLLGDDQQFVGLLALFTDLTPVRRLEGRVRDLQMLADLGEISAGIAHEFRNSLATMLGYLQLASREDLPQKARMQVEKAEREGALLSSAVDGLLAFARPMRLATARVRLDEIVAPLVDELRETSGVAIEFAPSEAAVDGDAALLSRAFENLLRNAVDSVVEKGSGRVFVTTEAKPHPRLEIRDEGVGLDPADVNRLLLPFQSDKTSGYGMGLPLARKIIALHNGSLHLTGAPGAGARVVVDFAST